jgi:hypothetical protein
VPSEPWWQAQQQGSYPGAEHFAAETLSLPLYPSMLESEVGTVIDAVAARVGFDPAPFRAVVAHVRGTKAIAKGEADAVLTAYHDGLKRFVAHVDAMLHPDSPAVN